jgi:5'-3' exonuclease
MGVLLTPIAVKAPFDPAQLRGRAVAVDGNGELYQFLALIRLRDGTPLRDSSGRVTSHLSGLFYRTTRFVAEYGIRFAFVFDGRPPELKRAEIERRRAVRDRSAREHAEAVRAGDLARAYSKATMMSRLTGEMVAEARELLDLRPDVADACVLSWRPPDRDAVIRFLCDKRQFSRERVAAALDRAFGARNSADLPRR